MIDYQFVNLQIASLQVIESIKWACKNNYKFLDFGISHQPDHVNPLTPKMSLIKFYVQFAIQTKAMIKKRSGNVHILRNHLEWGEGQKHQFLLIFITKNK